MRISRRLLSVAGLLLGLAGLIWTSRSPTRSAPVAGPAGATGSAARVPARGGARAQAEPVLRYLAIGGGAAPESTEVSLEQNLALARAVLTGPGALLFAGGRSSLSVRELAPGQERDALRVRLGDIFQPRPGRGSRYRKSHLEAAAATLQTVEASLERALSRGRDPLLLYVTSHGERGEQAADNHVALWGGSSLSARGLSELHDRHPRPLRAVITSCFSGGFAELAFHGADASRGASRAPRCGLFAGTHDRETSGCDPDPDRRKQEGYSLHFLQALAGNDRDGVALAGLDLDGDGAISLLEAHTRARIAARSIDVPTTTSERFLREVQPEPAASRARRAHAPPGGREEPAAHAVAATLPEEQAVVEQLGTALGLADEAAARASWEALDAELAALDARLTEAEAASQAAYQVLAAALLARWPTLDDAYHPAFERTLADGRAEIGAALRDGSEAHAFDAAERALSQLDGRYHEVLVRESMTLRLLRAHETLGLAAALARRGGPDHERFRRLVACERHVPGS